MKLPEKLSDCVDVALKDLDLVVGDPRYTVNFGAWHIPVESQFSTQCAVCFAGSVMAKSFGADITRKMAPSDFDDHNRDRFGAIDEIRKGYLSAALEYLEIESDLPDMEVNEDDYSKFKKDIKAIVRVLRKNGH